MKTQPVGNVVPLNDEQGQMEKKKPIISKAELIGFAVALIVLGILFTLFFTGKKPGTALPSPIPSPPSPPAPAPSA